MSDRAGQLLVSAAVLALGIALGAGAWSLPDPPGYASVSPKLFPALISAGLVITGAVLLWEVARGGFRNPPDDARGAFDLRAFAWLGAGLIAHMALIAGIGFVLASALLYTCAARGFGSVKPARDFAIGVAIGIVVYAIFTYGLTLALPWGRWMPGMEAS
jgi:putative tricarboxylic transport membrane protein